VEPAHPAVETTVRNDTSACHSVVAISTRLCILEKLERKQLVTGRLVCTQLGRSDRKNQQVPRLTIALTSEADGPVNPIELAGTRRAPVIWLLCKPTIEVASISATPISMVIVVGFNS
jgi:hypothetical protein